MKVVGHADKDLVILGIPAFREVVLQFSLADNRIRIYESNRDTLALK